MDAQRPHVRPLCGGLQAIAERELNERPGRVHEDITTLRNWILKQPHLRARTDDQFLVSFLRGSKFSLQKAKQKIDRFYTLKAALPEIFNERRLADDPIVLEIIRLGIILRLPMSTDETGPCVTIIRACSYDTSKYRFADVVRVGSMFGEIMMMEDDNASVSGYLEIMDMTNVTAGHFFQLQPELMRKFATFADEAMPIRQTGIHFIKVPPPFEAGFRTLKRLFPAKAMRRISVDADPDAILKYVSHRHLPLEYGGTNLCIQAIAERMESKMMEYRDYFEQERNYGTDEKLREGKPFTYENPLGIDGSFRKMNID